MGCANVIVIILLVFFILMTIMFLTLYIVEINKKNTEKKKLQKQIELNNNLTNLNKKLSRTSHLDKPYQLDQKDSKDIKELQQDENLYIFGIADEFKLICPENHTVRIKSMYTKIVDDVNGNSFINDITKFVGAFPMLNNQTTISMNAKLISDNLKLSIPYAMPHDEIVKTRVIYGKYACMKSV